MPIQQDREIIASEVNTELNIPGFLKQNDEITVQQLINRFGQANITVNSLITPNQLNNISVNGIPGTGGLDGTYNGVSFQQALEEGYIDTIIDNNGNWMLYLKVVGNTSIEFSNFGTKGNKIDYFVVGGGGGGTNDQYTGGGGNTSIEKQYALALNTPYTISVGKGGDVDKDGEQSAAFNKNAQGGKKGQRTLMTSCTYLTKPVEGGRVYYIPYTPYIKQGYEENDNAWESWGVTGNINVEYKLANEMLINEIVEINGEKCGEPGDRLENFIFAGAQDPYRYVLGIPDASQPISPTYMDGSNGEGRNTPVRPFGTADTSVPVVCGVASSKDSATVVYGQGGAANGGKGTQGVVILRNAR